MKIALIAVVFCLLVARLVWLATAPGRDGLRRMIGRRRLLKELKKEAGPLFEVVAACRQLAEAGHGGLIVVERRQSLQALARKGLPLDAFLSRELLFSVFTPPGALHDGAAVVRGGRIAAAGVILPLSQNPKLSHELGTRHRAGVGVSEICDALCLIVSEETGAISIADRGRLHYGVAPEKLAHWVERALRFKSVPGGKSVLLPARATG